MSLALTHRAQPGHICRVRRPEDTCCLGRQRGRAAWGWRGRVTQVVLKGRSSRGRGRQQPTTSSQTVLMLALEGALESTVLAARQVAGVRAAAAMQVWRSGAGWAAVGRGGGRRAGRRVRVLEGTNAARRVLRQVSWATWACCRGPGGRMWVRVGCQSHPLWRSGGFGGAWCTWKQWQGQLGRLGRLGRLGHTLRLAWGWAWRLEWLVQLGRRDQLSSRRGHNSSSGSWSS
ncbi:hypothetical protein V8C86DRAFT_2531503 [Haematococcus lacustris]